jgi:hypothetical protein
MDSTGSKQHLMLEFHGQRNELWVPEMAERMIFTFEATRNIILLILMILYKTNFSCNQTFI